VRLIEENPVEKKERFDQIMKLHQKLRDLNIKAISSQPKEESKTGSGFLYSFTSFFAKPVAEKPIPQLSPAEEREKAEAKVSEFVSL